jgi:hypothetical protein
VAAASEVFCDPNRVSRRQGELLAPVKTKALTQSVSVVFDSNAAVLGRISDVALRRLRSNRERKRQELGRNRISQSGMISLIMGGLWKLRSDSMSAAKKRGKP